MSNTISSNNAVGVYVVPGGSAVVSGVLSKVIMNNNNGYGITVSGAVTTGASLNVTIVDSEASNNNATSGVSTGVFVSSSLSTAATAVMLRDVVASNNSIGLHADVNGILRVAHSVVTGNGTGVSTSGGGIIKSYGDNDMNGNTNNNFGALTTIPTH